jgi:hypothetical protein
MLVNENRLNLADARARQYLARQMEQFFFGDGAEAPAGLSRPPPESGFRLATMRCGRWYIRRFCFNPGDTDDQTVAG